LFAAAQSYPCQSKCCFVNLTVGVRQNSDPDDGRRRYQETGRGNGTYSRIGGKHDGFKPSCLGPTKRKNCGHFIVPYATRSQIVESAMFCAPNARLRFRIRCFFRLLA
jgi:hypothetical protein